MNRESRMPAPRDRRHAITMAAFAAAALALAGCSEPAQHSTRLPALPIDPASVTVSGLSSGAAMATQLHVAHSGLIRGAALVAGMPYQCSGGTIRHSLGRCMKADEPIPTPRLIELTSRLALEGFIDPIADLADDRVWIFHGALDPYVRKPVADAVQAYYEALVNPANVTRVELEQAGHTFPTERTDASACDVTEPPFVGSCGYDGAAALLEYLYGSLSPGRAPHEGELVEFDQRPYARAAGSEGLAAKGLLFVPDACRAGGDRSGRTVERAFGETARAHRQLATRTQRRPSRCRRHRRIHAFAQNRFALRRVLGLIPQHLLRGTSHAGTRAASSRSSRIP